MSGSQERFITLAYFYSVVVYNVFSRQDGLSCADFLIGEKVILANFMELPNFLFIRARDLERQSVFEFTG